MVVGHLEAHGLGDGERDLPVGHAVLGRHHLAHAVDAALGVGERAVLLEEGRARQEDVGVVRRLVQEQVLDDNAFHCREGRLDVLGVGIGLQDVLALHVDALEGAVDCGIEHVGDAQAGLGIERTAPQLLEHGARGVVGDVTVARQLVREGAHVARALDVVLAAQRVHADARTAEIAGRHREVGERHHRRRALAVLGDAEAIVDRAVLARGIEPGGTADRLGRHTGHQADRLGAVLRLRDEGRPVLEGAEVAVVADELLVHQAFGDDDMGEILRLYP